MAYREEDRGVKYENFIGSSIDEEGLIKIELKDNFDRCFFKVGQVDGFRLKHYIQTQLNKFSIKRILNVIPSDYTNSYLSQLTDDTIERNILGIKILRVYIEGLKLYVDNKTLCCKKISKELWIATYNNSNIFMLYMTDSLDINSYKEKLLLQRVNENLFNCSKRLLEEKLLKSIKVLLNETLHKEKE